MRDSGRIDLERLPAPTAHRRQALGLPGGLHALRHRVEIECVGDGEQCLNRFDGLGVVVEIVDELAVDLERVDRGATQIGQGGEAGTEVVENQPNAEIAE
jgi:hypothetical protein